MSRYAARLDCRPGPGSENHTIRPDSWEIMTSMKVGEYDAAVRQGAILPPRDAAGQIPFKAVAALVNALAQKRVQDGAIARKELADLELVLEKARELKLKNDRSESLSVPLDEVNAALAGLMVAIRGNLEAAPHKIAQQIGGKNEQAIRDQMTTLVRQILSQASHGIEALKEQASTPPDAQVDAAAEPAPEGRPRGAKSGRQT